MSERGSICQQLEVPFALNCISECQITQRRLDFLRELECPVCLDQIFPPVMQCVNGHPTCIKCLRSLTEPICPICKGGAGASRNLCAEKFLERHIFRCVNHEHNCPEFYWVEQEGLLREHELDCKFRKCHCWIPNCNVQPFLEEVSHHWFSEHENLRGRNYLGSLTHYVFEVGRGSPEYRSSAFKFEFEGNLFLTIFQRLDSTLYFYTYCYSPQSRAASQYESVVKLSISLLRGRSEVFGRMDASWTGPIHNPVTPPSQILDNGEKRFKYDLPRIRDVNHCRLHCEAELRIRRKLGNEAPIPEELILL